MESLESSSQKLVQAIEVSDYQDIAFVAHSLKGVAGNIMAVSVAEKASQTEISAKSKEPTTIAYAKELQGLIERLILELKCGPSSHGSEAKLSNTVEVD